MFFPEEHGVPPYDELIYVAKQDRFGDPKFDRFFEAIEEATMHAAERSGRGPGRPSSRLSQARRPPEQAGLGRYAAARFQAAPKAVDPIAISGWPPSCGRGHHRQGGAVERYVGKR